jgi:hypothetical protein
LEGIVFFVPNLNVLSGLEHFLPVRLAAPSGAVLFVLPSNQRIKFSKLAVDRTQRVS